MTNPPPRFQSLSDFYPYYLGEHRNGTCRLLHLIGSSSVLMLLAASLLTNNYWLLLGLAFAGYGPAWVGHYFFERNRPATFDYPGYSFVCDWIMMRDILLGRVPLLGDLPEELCVDEGKLAA
ncbi:MAG TPA: DUF962 domain-containing protein [Deltaproteobacteria bacterium]|nr:hypothetical protein [Deltaproteobacteria bacterium]HCP47858.1 DUF962 domain-containing protein [Deltaproteobacteria bacterium]